MTQSSSPKGRSGFTLLELLVTVSLVGILIGIAVPIANVYRLKAEYSRLQTTIRYLMDGEESYFLENDTFYPQGFGVVRVRQGEEKAIPELNYIFPSGHKHAFYVYALNLAWGSVKYNYTYIYVYADFDRDRNGRNDLYMCMTYLRDNEPLETLGERYYRLTQQLW